jgi:hypothetical protein
MITATEAGLSMIKSSNYIIFHLNKFDNFHKKRYSIVEQLVAFYILKALESYKNELNQKPASIAKKVGVSTRVVQRVIKKMDADGLIISNKLRDICDSPVASSDSPVASSDSPVASSDQSVASSDSLVANCDQSVANLRGKCSDIPIVSLQDHLQDTSQHTLQEVKTEPIYKNIKSRQLTTEEKTKEIMNEFDKTFGNI